MSGTTCCYVINISVIAAENKLIYHHVIHNETFPVFRASRTRSNKRKRCIKSESHKDEQKKID